MQCHLVIRSCHRTDNTPKHSPALALLNRPHYRARENQVRVGGYLLSMEEPHKVTLRQNTCPRTEQDAQGCLQHVWLFSTVKHRMGKTRMLVMLAQTSHSLHPQPLTTKMGRGWHSVQTGWCGESFQPSEHTRTSCGIQPNYCAAAA